MKRVVTIALVFAAVMVFTLARPVAASDRYWATGANAQINLAAQCDEDFAYPANTAFYIVHGWVETPWITDSSANKQAFMGAATYFELQIDGVAQPSSMIANYLPDQDLKQKLFVSGFDQGLTGTHTLSGLWFVDAEFVGGTPGVPLFAFGCTSTVTFV